jgi:hypothetical protein
MKCFLCGQLHVYDWMVRFYGARVCIGCGEALMAHHQGGLTFFWYWDWLEAYGLHWWDGHARS